MGSIKSMKLSFIIHIVSGGETDAVSEEVSDQGCVANVIDLKSSSSIQVKSDSKSPASTKSDPYRLVSKT